MSGLLGDFRYAFRMLLKHPAVSGLAVVALGLGIGLTAVMFSIVYGALMRGLPFENGDRIMAIRRANPSREIEQMSVSVHDYLDWRAQQTSFEELAGFFEGTVNVRWTDQPERFDGAFVSANTFRAVGVQPMLGRGFRDEDDVPGSPATVILSHHVWMDRFQGDRTAVGQIVKVNGEQAEIIGVMPEDFLFPNRQDLWVPLRIDALAIPRGEGTGLSVFGPLREDVTLDAALAEFTGIAQRLSREYPDTNEGVIPAMRPFTEQFIGDEASALLYTMLAVVSLVLLIACANVANLLLARAAQRTREVGIRTALGAKRARVIGQMVIEAFALALGGAVLGTAIAWIGLELFQRAVADTDPPFFLVFKVDAPILGFILLASVLAAVVAGGIPALKASGLDVNSVLKDESRGSSSLRVGRLSRVLVVGQIAMSLGLLVAAGLMTKSITTLRDFDFGFDPDPVFTARVGLFETEFPDSASRRIFFRELDARLKQVPGVTASALGTILPGLGSNGAAVGVEGRAYAEDRDYPFSRWGQVGPGYFAAVGVDVIQGRDFNLLDDETALPVAVVNRSFADKHFPGEDPLGRRFRTGRSESSSPWLTVVGVVPDLYMEGVGNLDSEKAGFYVPVAQSDARFMSILARGPSDPMSLSEAVRRAVMSVHSDTPTYFVQSLADRISESTWFYRVFGALFMVFGGAALFLAAVGLYGVMSFTAARRTPEVGIRMALGADGRQVLELILRQGVTQILVGLVLGVAMGVLVSRGLRTVLFEVSPNDPAVFAGIAAILAATGILASLVPAWRATKVDPIIALRYE